MKILNIDIDRIKQIRLVPFENTIRLQQLNFNTAQEAFYSLLDFKIPFVFEINEMHNPLDMTIDKYILCEFVNDQPTFKVLKYFAAITTSIGRQYIGLDRNTRELIEKSMLSKKSQQDLETYRLLKLV